MPWNLPTDLGGHAARLVQFISEIQEHLIFAGGVLQHPNAFHLVKPFPPGG